MGCRNTDCAVIVSADLQVVGLDPLGGVEGLDGGEEAGLAPRRHQLPPHHGHREVVTCFDQVSNLYIDRSVADQTRPD